VFVLLGNHEFYRNESVKQTWEKVKSICDKDERLVLMNKTSLRLRISQKNVGNEDDRKEKEPEDEGDMYVRIVGTTLWSEGKPEHYKVLESRMSDYHQ